MAHYDVTYACGHTGSVNLVGKHSYREWQLERMAESPCLDCYKAQQFEAAQAATKERELVPLIGTQKQIEWATSIRLRLLDELEQLEDMLVQAQTQRTWKPEDQQVTLRAIDALLATTSAHQWIEWRDQSIERIVRDLKKQVLNAPTPAQVALQQQEAQAKARAEAAALAEATLRPDLPVTEMLAEITCTEDAVRVRLPENMEAFKDVVRSLGYIWDGEQRCWQRTLRVSRTGPARERAIELGHVLLSHGFCLCVFDADLRAAIAAGVFEPEQTRWISVYVKGDYVGWFCIDWGAHEDYYAVARRLPQSRYVKPHVAVPSTSYSEVLDFAERYGFRLTSAAHQHAHEAAAQRAATLVVKKARPAPRSNTVAVASTMPPVLEVPTLVEVAAEFRDEGEEEEVR